MCAEHRAHHSHNEREFPTAGALNLALRWAWPSRTSTLLTAAGVAPRVVMEILGHSQISITMDVYVHVVQDTQREAMSHMDRLLRRRPGRQ